MKKYIYIIVLILSLLCEKIGFCQSISTDKNAVVHSKLRIATTNESDANDPTKALINITYSDGLGRTLQTVGYQQSPTQKDIIIGATNYDKYGRPTFSVLPSPATTGTGIYQNNPIGLGQSFYSDNRPYSSVLLYENSILSREREVLGVGQAWATNNKKGQIFDETAGSDVRLYKLDANNNVIKDGFFPANSLFKKRFIDEQGHTSIEISDKQGRMIQKQQQDESGFITTYYIYDGLSRIKVSIQPEGYELDASINYNSDEWKRWVFFYLYDHRGRLTEKKVPSADLEYFAYDKWDRMVLSQTAQQRQFQRWTFYKYDNFNREIIRGELSDGGTLATAQAYINQNATVRFEERTSISPYYTNNTYPSFVGENNYRQINFYDNYDNWLPSDMTFEIANAYHSQHPLFKGFLTGNMKLNSETNNWLFTALYYDNKRHIIQSFSHNLHTQIERTDLEYNFMGEFLQSRSSHKYQTNTVTFTEQTQNDLDYMGRVKKILFGINALPTELVRFTHDELSRMAQKKILPNDNFVMGGTPEFINRPPSPNSNIDDIARRAIFLNVGTLIDANNINKYTAQINPEATQGIEINGLQTIDFSHHIRGGLRGINLDNAGNPVPKASEGDLFAYKLDYETTGFYDGNIGKQTWQTTDNTNLPLGVRSYTFDYDISKRLKNAAYAGLSNENYSLPNISYDKNGNITTLQRNGKTGNTFGSMDNLSYVYNGNRLSQVTDAISSNNEVDLVPRGSGSYDYYNDGSLKSDENERISNIVYDTFLKQPKEVYLTDGTWYKHYYDGGGALLKTVYSTGEYWEYLENIIYKNGQPFQMTMPEGRAVYQNGTWQKEFFYTDLSGNTRVAFQANGNNLEKTSETAFDPWGVVLRGAGQVNTIQNRFEYQNKEKESTFGLNRINLGARTYNPTIGRMDRVDIMADKLPFSSTYVYSSNNPLKFIDTNGEFPIDITIRSFAPLNSFGGGFKGDGVHRRFSIDPSAKSKLNATTSIETNNMSITNKIGRSTTSVGGYGLWKAESDTKVSSSMRGNTLNMKASAGNDAVIPFADTDVTDYVSGNINHNANLTFGISNGKNGSQILKITGNLTGDSFPAGEAFATDASGTSVFLGVSPLPSGIAGNAVSEGSAPYLLLTGDNNRPMASVNITITVDKKGNFTGVVGQNGKVMSIQDYNKSFENQSTSNNNLNTPRQR